MWRSGSIFFLAMALTLWHSACRAEIVRFRLTGKVAINGSPLNILPEDLVAGADTNVLEPPDFNSPGGKRFVAYWSYDTSVPDSRPDMPASGVYAHPLADPLTADFGLSVKIDQYVFRFDTLSEPYTVNVGVGRLVPDCAVGCGDGVGTDDAPVIAPFEYDSPTIIHDRIALSIGESLLSTIEDSTLPTDALPATIDLADFDCARIQITGSGEVWLGDPPVTPTFFIQAWVNEMTIVPEPNNLSTILIQIRKPPALLVSTQ